MRFFSGIYLVHIFAFYHQKLFPHRTAYHTDHRYHELDPSGQSTFSIRKPLLRGTIVNRTFWYIQKPVYRPILTQYIWLYLLWPLAIARLVGWAPCSLHGLACNTSFPGLVTLVCNSCTISHNLSQSLTTSHNKSQKVQASI